MILTGISDEAGNTIDAQIAAAQELGWRYLEMRGVEVPGFPKANFHEIPDEAFALAADKLQAAGLRVYCFGSTIMNWAKTVQTPFEVTLGEVQRCIPRMQRLGTKFVRIMSFKPGDEEDRIPEEVFRRVRDVTKRFLDAGLQPVHENCFWTRVRDVSTHIHIKDATWNPAKNDADYNWPGEGKGRVRDILKDAFTRGYDAGISIEPHMVVVFHDAGSKAGDEPMRQNFVEYGQRLEKLIREIKAELRPGKEQPVTAAV
jgi:sugar phosphate isomerase/epimerase